MLLSGWPIRSPIASTIAGSFLCAAQPPSPKPPRVSSSGRPGPCMTPSRVTWLTTATRIELTLSRRPEPGGQRFGESGVGSVSDPGDVSVGPDQHGGGSGDHAEHRQLPLPVVARVDQLDPVGP